MKESKRTRTRPPTRPMHRLCQVHGASDAGHSARTGRPAHGTQIGRRRMTSREQGAAAARRDSLVCRRAPDAGRGVPTPHPPPEDTWTTFDSAESASGAGVWGLSTHAWPLRSAIRSTRSAKLRAPYMHSITASIQSPSKPGDQFGNSAGCSRSQAPEILGLREKGAAATQKRGAIN